MVDNAVAVNHVAACNGTLQFEDVVFFAYADLLLDNVVVDDGTRCKRDEDFGKLVGDFAKVVAKVFGNEDRAFLSDGVAVLVDEGAYPVGQLAVIEFGALEDAAVVVDGFVGFGAFV